MSASKEPSPITASPSLLAMYVLYSLLYRSYASCSVLALSKIGDGGVVAIAGLLISFLIFVSATSLGSIIDRTDRMTAMLVLVLVQISSVACEYSMSGYLLYNVVSVASNSPYMFILPLLSAISALMLSLCAMNIEKDWVVVISNKDTKHLSYINSYFYQIDLLCNSLVPALIGYLYTKYSTPAVLALMAVFNSAVGLSLILLLRIVYSQYSVLQVRAARAALKNPGELRTSSVFNMVKDLSVAGCAAAMISLALLYLNVMSFGSLMTLYQSRNGINEYWIGVSQGVAAMIGVSGVTIFPYVERRFGLIPTAAMAIWYQVVFVSCAFYFLGRNPQVWYFTCAVLISRSGLWIFDLCTRQIVQETVEETIRGKMNGHWSSLIAFFDMTSYALAMIITGDRQFLKLSMVSEASLISAAVIFTVANWDYIFRGVGRSTGAAGSLSLISKSS